MLFAQAELSRAAIVTQTLFASLYVPPRQRVCATSFSARAAALARASLNDLVVLEGLQFGDYKTKQVTDLLNALELQDALLVIGGSDEKIEKSAANLSSVTVLRPEGVNVYDILLRSKLVMTKDAVEAVTNRLGGGA